MTPPDNKRERIAAALLSPNGDVISVIAIVRATDDQLRDAQRVAASRGFSLYVHQGVRMCVDQATLREAILDEAKS